LLPAPDPRQRLELLVGLTIDVRAPAATLVVDRARPPERPRGPGAGEVDAVVAPALDHVADDGLAVPLGRGREAAEVAAAAGVAVAELDVRAGDSPLGHRRDYLPAERVGGAYLIGTWLVPGTRQGSKGQGRRLSQCAGMSPRRP